MVSACDPRFPACGARCSSAALPGVPGAALMRRHVRAQVTGGYGGYGGVPGAAGADYYGRPAGGGFAGAYEPAAAGPSAAPYGGGAAPLGGGAGVGSGGGGALSSSESAWHAQARTLRCLFAHRRCTARHVTGYCTLTLLVKVLGCGATDSRARRRCSWQLSSLAMCSDMEPANLQSSWQMLRVRTPSGSSVRLIFKPKPSVLIARHGHSLTVSMAEHCRTGNMAKLAKLLGKEENRLCLRGKSAVVEGRALRRRRPDSQQGAAAAPPMWARWCDSM